VQAMRCPTIGESVGERGIRLLEFGLRFARGFDFRLKSGVGGQRIAELDRPARIDGARIRLVALADLLDDPRVHPEGPKRLRTYSADVAFAGHFRFAGLLCALCEIEGRRIASDSLPIGEKAPRLKTKRR